MICIPGRGGETVEVGSTSPSGSAGSVQAIATPTKDVPAHRYPGWREFETHVALALGRLPTDGILVLTARSASGEPTYFVQFRQRGLAGFVAEAVSNNYLIGSLALSPIQEQQMADLGWQWPAEGAAKPENFNREWPMRAPFDEVARLAVATLREVYGVKTTSDLAYRAVAKAGGEYAIPGLGIDGLAGNEPPSGASRAPTATVQELGPLVEAAVRAFTGVTDLQRDKDGDLPIRMGSAMVFVRVVDATPPTVMVFAPVIWGVATSSDLLAAINEANAQVHYGRLFWNGREVIVASELPAIGLTPEEIAFACFQVGAIADHFDDQLQATFGGKTMFGATGKPAADDQPDHPIGFQPPS
jgi:hypothetical protein